MISDFNPYKLTFVPLLLTFLRVLSGGNGTNSGSLECL